MSYITEIIVSFRIPASLLKKLRECEEAHDYLDLSELIRSIVRKNWLVSKDPVFYEIQKLRQELKEEIRRGKSEE